MKFLMLVNKQNTLSELYIPEELIQAPSTGIWIRKEVYKAFSNMNQTIQGEGLSELILISGYRSYEYQQKVFDRKVNNLMQDGLSQEEATDKARTIVALPGTSEHQTGLAIDLTNSDLAKKEDPLIEEFELTEHGEWLDLHAQEYGFILRYPKDKVGITHITYEPWHYRYIGITHAKRIKALKMCLEEYNGYLNKK